MRLSRKSRWRCCRLKPAIFRASGEGKSTRPLLTRRSDIGSLPTLINESCCLCNIFSKYSLYFEKILHRQHDSLMRVGKEPMSERLVSNDRVLLPSPEDRKIAGVS